MAKKTYTRAEKNTYNAEKFADMFLTRIQAGSLQWVKGWATYSAKNHVENFFRRRIWRNNRC